MDVKFEFGANDAQLQGAFERAMTNMNRLSQKADSASNFMKTLGQGMVSYFSFSAAINTAVQAIEKMAKMEQVQTQFETMLGSVERAAELVKELKDLGAATPFEFKELSSSTQKLLAFGFTAKEAVQHLKMLGDIASGAGQPIEELALLFGKVRANGRIMGDDLNQLVDRNIPMISGLAKHFGVAESEVRKLVETGKVGFPEVLAIMQKLTEEGGMFAGSMEKQAETIAGKLSTLQDAFDALSISVVENFGAEIKIVLDAVIAGLSRASQKLKEFQAFMGALGATGYTYGPEFDAEYNRRMGIGPQEKTAKQIAQEKAVAAKKELADKQRAEEEINNRIRKTIEDSEKKEKVTASIKAKKDAELNKKVSEEIRVAKKIGEAEAEAENYRSQQKIEFLEKFLAGEEKLREVQKKRSEVINGMVYDAGKLAEFAGLEMFRQASIAADDLADALGISVEEATKLDRLNRGLEAFNKAEAGKQRNMLKEEREQRRLEREGKQIAQEIQRRKEQKEDPELARRARGVSRKAEAQVDALEKAQAAQKKAAQEQKEREDKANKLLKEEKERNQQTLLEIKVNTQKTSEQLEKLTRA